MTAFDPQNVFTRVEAGLWKVLEDDALFAATVKVANRVKYHADKARPSADLPKRQDSDHPYVRIVPVSAAQNMERSSSGATFWRTYAIQCSTGDERTHAGINVVDFAVFKAFERNAGSVALDNVPEVEDVVLTSTDYGKAKVEGWAGDKDGWFAVWLVRVRLTFDRATLIA